MTSPLERAVAQDLAAEVPEEVTTAAAALAAELGGVAVLFYGSVLRTRALDDILDFYVLTAGARGSVVRRAALRWLWPDVSYHEIAVSGRTLRAKVATMPLETFERAVGGGMLDTTLWARFTQPSALVWAVTSEHRQRVVRAVADAAITASRFAAALGAPTGTAESYWRALLRETYKAELRVEKPGREGQILAHAPARYDTLLPLAWESGGIGFERQGAVLTPLLSASERRATVSAWRNRARAGKPLNVARLVKAAFTFEGAARYGLWKIERHTGVQIALTPWRERHPILAAPGVLWRVLRPQPR